jgi:outer membrane protein assembly factor BamB
MTRSLLPRLLLTAGLLLPLVPATRAHGEPEWLQWGGPNGNFTVDTEGLASSWPESGPRRLWKRPLGEGYSAIVGNSGRLYTMIREDETEVVVALDASTGATVWRHRYDAAFWPDMVERFGPGPNATPAIAGDRLVSIGINGDLRCLALGSGELLWRHDLVAEYGRRKRDEEYGYSNSPVLYRDTVIVMVSGNDHGVVAFDPKDGNVVWKSAPSGISYAQATLMTIDGQDMLVFFSFTEVIGLDPANGRFLWSHPCAPGNGNNLTPAFLCGERHVWVASQFDQGGGRVLEIRKHDDRFDVTQLWLNRRMQSTHWTSIPIGDHIYGSIGGNNVSLLCAVNWKTGAFSWRHRGFHKCMCLHADDKLILLDENGQLALARVSPDDIDVLARAQVTESVSWTVPTLLGTTLYVRDRKSILALDLGVPAPD